MSGGSDSNGVAGGIVAGVGITVLPNTGGSPVTQVITIVIITLGALVFATTVARMISKRAYKR